MSIGCLCVIHGTECCCSTTDTYCYRKSSVRHVYPSVTLKHCSMLVGLVLKLITEVFAPRRRRNIVNLVHGEHSQNSGGIGVGVAVLSRKPAISLKRGKIGPRLRLATRLCENSLRPVYSDTTQLNSTQLDVELS